MKVLDATHEYLSYMAGKNLKPGTVQMAQQVLQSIFEPVLAEDLLNLTIEQLTALRSQLATRASQTTGAPLTQGTRHSYLRVSRAFLSWCASKGWMLAALNAVLDPDRPPALPPEIQAPHLGGLVRTLREAAGLTRQALGARTGLGQQTLQDRETGRRRPSRRALQQLRKDPSSLSFSVEKSRIYRRYLALPFLCKGPIEVLFRGVAKGGGG